MEQEQEAELVFRRVRVIDGAGFVSWVDKPLLIGYRKVEAAVKIGASQDVGDALGGQTAA